MTQHPKKTINSAKNSWYLKVGFVHHYLCACGQSDAVSDMVSNIRQPWHTCYKCKNHHFVDSETLINNPSVAYWDKFFWQYKSYRDEFSWKVKATADIPLFDYAAQKIMTKSIILASISLKYDGADVVGPNFSSICKKYVYNGRIHKEQILNIIKKEISIELINAIIDKPLDDTQWFTLEKLQSFDKSTNAIFDTIRFFLKNKHLKCIDYYLWNDLDLIYKEDRHTYDLNDILSYIINHRKEKSVRRALYNSYTLSIRDNKYSPKSDIVFSRIIRDPNFLVPLIEMEQRVKYRLFDGIPIEEIYSFDTLLHSYYSTKQVALYWLRISHGNIPKIINDTLKMFCNETTKEAIQEYFDAPKATPMEIHDELVRLHNYNHIKNNKPICNQTFFYSEHYYKAEQTYSNLTFRLPKDSHELYEWSTLLHNCMSIYVDKIISLKSIIYGIFDKENLLYGVEINNLQIVQAYGKYNKTIDSKDMQIITKWKNKFLTSPDTSQ